MKYFIFTFLGSLCFLQGAAQSDTINVLGEVLLQDIRLKDSSYTRNYTVLNDSVLKRNQASLTNLLNFNSNVYFKENGAGMVSSPSFRGTTASQTAVLWNGININSQTTGQTDFNTINTRGFDQIVVKPGGSGVEDGSNAIGGSIYLENILEYHKGFRNSVFLNYGSFNTYGVNYKTAYSEKNTSFSLGYSRNGSDNDYPYLGTERKNKNGNYHNTNIALSGGIKLSRFDEIRLFSNIYDGKRNFSLPTPNALATKYYDFNTRSLLEWVRNYKRISSSAKLAYITEDYEYYPNVNNDFFTYGNVESLFVKYNLNYRLTKKIALQGKLNYTRNDGEGSDISQEIRNLGSVILGIKHQISDKVLYEVSLRQELNEDYENPFLYSAGISTQFTDFYHLKINTSKSFRIPTYNDLYWQGVGNTELSPELSYQGEISNLFKFWKNTFQFTVYYNSVENLLSWVPDVSGVWRPQNTERVEIYGLETMFHFQEEIGAHKFALDGTYAYTVSENQATQNQLIYVPYHKLTASLSYAVKNFSAYYQYLNNGEVYTTTDNAPEHILDNYMVANLGMEYALGKNKNYEVGVQLLNLWGASYASVLNRPMPGRNVNAYLNLNF